MFDRVCEVEASPDGHLDLWARGHYKSSTITFGLTIQDILASHGDDPLPKWGGIEPTFGIFSHTRPTAKKFLQQIKVELEVNPRLLEWFPDVLWANPHRESPRWSDDGGLIVKRRSNPKESTVEAWGLVDGQPTGAHFTVRIYDDVISREAVNTPEMIQRTTEAWELSINLGVEEGGKERYIGTRYSYADTYHEIMQRAVVIPRIYPSTHDGTETGKPVLLTPEEHDKRRRAMGKHTFSAQMLQKPVSKATATFDIDHLKFAEVRPKTINVYVVCDPAHSKRRGSDRTAMAVIAVDAQRNMILVDGFNHKMNLTERWTAFKGLRKKWRNAPGVQSIYMGYERYGMQSDLEHFESEMRRAGEAFEIMELAWPREGPGAKGDRVGRLRPDFENGHFFLSHLVRTDEGMCYIKVEDGEVKHVPCAGQKETALMAKTVRAGEKYRLMVPIRQKDEESRLYDLTTRFIEEYLAHPDPGAFDDLVDAVSRIHDMEVVPPIIINQKDLEPEVFVDS